MRIASLLAVGLMTAAAAAPARSLQAVKAQFPLGSSAILEQPDRMVLYALDPGSAKRKGATFHGFAVVTEKAITGATRGELVGALFQAMREQHSGARCFVPHHGLRAVRGAKTVDLVLCFTCQWVDIHHAGKKNRALLAAKPMALYDRVLR